MYDKIVGKLLQNHQGKGLPDMKEKIEKEISMLEMRIASEQKRLDCEVAEFKESAQKYDAYNIATFIPGRVSSINGLYQRIRVLNDQLNMLAWMLGEGAEE